MEEYESSYNEINFYARMIARRVEDTESITHVVGLARGGLVPATVISYALDKPLLTYGISSYEGSKKTDSFHISQSLNLNELKEKNNNIHILVVDDICDTGDTIKHFTTKLSIAGIKNTTACIYTKEQHTELLDHYGLVVPDNKWIVFPWE
jgi:hypoxanthine phosphoribosyltransferase